ncbi:MAG: S46 family peptidase [Planctomycetes bacterium]|nr:S46 family peptidase [Planctomycetota bacterium]
MTTTLARAATTRRSRGFGAALLFVLGALCTAPATAQTRKELGRMWTFEAAPVGWFQEAYDWAPSDEWLDHARLASLRLGQRDEKGEIRFFCSASFVSPHGLIMTNHHCSRDAIAALQGDDDWLKDGFYAGGYDGEIHVKGLLVSQMVGQTDVTEAVAAQGEQAVLAGAKEEHPELRHEIIALYQGGNYQLYSYKVYDDLRLVCAPHGQSAHFGGDPDNFCYPRWGLDFSFLRAYEGGKPVDTKANCFEWRTEGADEGEVVFVTGNPGRTGRLKTHAQCEFLRDHYYPPLVARYEGMVAQLHEKAKESAAAEKELRPQILRFENSRKALQGYLDGLRDPRILEIKAKAEAELRAEVAKRPELQEKYGDAWDQLALIQTEKVQAMKDGKNPGSFAEDEARHEKRIGEACFAVYGTSIPPDATMSLRISDGVVKGYPMNGTLAPYFTTLYGLFARHAEFGGVHPFDMPQAWLDAEPKLDLKTPFNFVATCDIIGGNSGSPMIDKEQRVIGLVFDGNIEMLGNNYVFDDEISRTVSVHPAIIIEALRKIYRAGALANELERKGQKKERVGIFEGVRRASDEAKVTKAKTDIVVLADSVRLYYTQNGRLPASIEVLAEPDDKGRTWVTGLSDDPWGNAYQLREGRTPREFEVVSYGPDGSEGTGDDLSSRKRS